MDSEDLEADAVYASIDKALASRRTKQRQEREREQTQLLQASSNKTPTIQAQFKDLKDQLRHVSWDEWMNIPEAGEIRGNVAKKFKKENPLKER